MFIKAKPSSVHGFTLWVNNKMHSAMINVGTLDMLPLPGQVCICGISCLQSKRVSCPRDSLGNGSSANTLELQDVCSTLDGSVNRSEPKYRIPQPSDGSMPLWNKAADQSGEPVGELVFKDNSENNCNDN